jgi:hypothetical protein
MPPRLKSLWGTIRIELHFVKSIPLKKVLMTLIACSMLFVPPQLVNVLQKRTLGEIFNGVSNTFFKVSTNLHLSGKSGLHGRRLL